MKIKYHIFIKKAPHPLDFMSKTFGVQIIISAFPKLHAPS